jgi:hypothetical protein
MEAVRERTTKAKTTFVLALFGSIIVQKVDKHSSFKFGHFISLLESGSDVMSTFGEK